MKLKIFNLLTASLVTLGLFADGASAFNSNHIAPQTSIKEAHLLKGGSGNSRGSDREWAQNQRLVSGNQAVESMQFFSVAVAPNTTQSSQPKLAWQTDQSPSFLAGVFFTFVLIGFILGCILQYRQYRKERAKRTAAILLEIETLAKIRLLERKNLERIEKMKSDIDETIIPQREKQLETLERIWKMRS